MPDPIPTQEQLDDARESFIQRYQGRRLNLASRIILSVCGPWIVFSVLGAFAADRMLEAAASAGRTIGFGGNNLSFDAGWTFWLNPIGALLSTFWLLFLWRKPFNPKPLVSRLQSGSENGRLKEMAADKLTGFQGFVKSLFI